MKDGNSVEENVINLISKIGEKITIRRCNFFDNNTCMNFPYVHAAIKKKYWKTWCGCLYRIYKIQSTD